MADFFFEAFLELLFEGGKLHVLDEGDGAASEAGSCHTCAKASRAFLSEVNGEVEFFTGDFIVISERCVRLGKQGTEALGVVGFEFLNRLENAGLFGDDVARSLPYEFVVDRREVFEFGLTEPGYWVCLLKDAKGVFALPPALVELGVCEGSGRSGVEDDEGLLGEGDGHGGDFGDGAVHEEGGLVLPGGDGEGVHDAALNPDALVLDLLAELGEGDGVISQIGLEFREQGIGGGDDHGGGGRESRAHGDGAYVVEFQACLGGDQTLLCEFGEDREGVAPPEFFDGLVDLIEGELAEFWGALRAEDDLVVLTAREAEGHAEVEGHGEDQAAVVVEMFADEIDAGGGVGVGEGEGGWPSRHVHFLTFFFFLTHLAKFVFNSYHIVIATAFEYRD